MRLRRRESGLLSLLDRHARRLGRGARRLSSRRHYPLHEGARVKGRRQSGGNGGARVEALRQSGGCGGTRVLALVRICLGVLRTRGAEALTEARGRPSGEDAAHDTGARRRQQIQDLCPGRRMSSAGRQHWQDDARNGRRQVRLDLREDSSKAERVGVGTIVLTIAMSIIDVTGGLFVAIAVRRVVHRDVRRKWGLEGREGRRPGRRGWRHYSRLAHSYLIANKSSQVKSSQVKSSQVKGH